MLARSTCKMPKPYADWVSYICVTFVVVWSISTVHADQQAGPPPKAAPGWWGRGDGKGYVEDTAIHAYEVFVDNEVLIDLERRLNNTIFPEMVEDANFDYGFNSEYLKTLIHHWCSEYQWRKQEKRINSLTQFKTQIEGVHVHFLHVKPPEKLPKGMRVLPLLLAHGWPGSFVEFLDIIPMLITPRKGVDFVFELIIPTYPGYGFSEAPHKKGFGQVACAQVFGKLMERLGFKSYYVQGGDIGYLVVTNMALLYPERVKGVHLNALTACTLCGQGLANEFLVTFPVNATDAQRSAIIAGVNQALEETGYYHIQSTKPSTVGIAVGNSPAGLAAYIFEKMSWATNPVNAHASPTGLIGKTISLDSMLNIVMIYWITGSMSTSMNAYKEHYSKVEQNYGFDAMVVKTPTAVAHFPYEPIMIPEAQARSRYVNMLFWTDMPKGGHFAAMEEPKLLSDDVYKFVAAVEKH